MSPRLSCALLALAFSGVIAAHPAPAEQSASVLHARDFGAVPDDGKDDAAALRKAVKAAKAFGGAPVRLVLGKGVYDLTDLEGGERAVPLTEMKNFTLEGGGATLLSHGRTLVLPVFRCENIVVENLDFDCEPKPFAGMRVTAGSPGSFDAEVLPPLRAARGSRGQGGHFL